MKLSRGPTTTAFWRFLALSGPFWNLLKLTKDHSPSETHPLTKSRGRESLSIFKKDGNVFEARHRLLLAPPEGIVP